MFKIYLVEKRYADRSEPYGIFYSKTNAWTYAKHIFGSITELETDRKINLDKIEELDAHDYPPDRRAKYVGDLSDYEL